VALVAAFLLLYSDALRTGFLNDDFLFLEEARRRSLLESLRSLDPLGNFFRPVSRQLYYEALVPLLGDRAWAFHLVNFGVFLAALALLADLLRSFLPLPGVLAGTLVFALAPFQRVNLTWISCSQDLLALLFALAAVALFRRRRDRLAAAAYLLAVFSKESALPLPLVLAAWAFRLDRSEGAPSWNAVLRRLAPFGVVATAWIAVTLWVRGASHPTRPLDFSPGSFAAGYAHGVQSLLGLDHPAGLLRGLAHPGAPSLALVPLALVALVLRRSGSSAEAPARTILVLAAVWLLAFGVVIGPVAAIWSSYYYTLFAVGGALAAGWLARRLGALGWIVLCLALVWWHGAATSARAFAVKEDAWVWTSHLTPFYFQREAALTDSLRRQMLRDEPNPEPGTRFFFSSLPSWAGFQMGNGPLLRALYRDPKIQSWFYSQFSESTAADRPCRFLTWDGSAFAPLYPSPRDRFFQVGSDLLAMDRLEGARHAFRRAILQGEPPLDPWYWLGWTELWLGRRAAGEAAWTRFGAKDDPSEWLWQMRLARQALNDKGDTLAARRALAAAIRSGIGRPEPHAVLGELLLQEHPKYAVLELKVAAFLKPDDWVARRDLALALGRSGLDDDARLQLAQLASLGHDWRGDSLLAGLARRMERRSAAPPVIEF
jgi:hypothetical protein